ncbi:periplasmic binding protein-like I [Powellomyces hirtus]|nr:periplasmic binding protein-like I [Powellomyces hirtus]
MQQRLWALSLILRSLCCGIGVEGTVIKLAVMYPYSYWNKGMDAMEERAYKGAALAAAEIQSNITTWFPGATRFEVHRKDDGSSKGQNKGLVVAAAQSIIADSYQGVIGERYSDYSKMLSWTLSTTSIFQCSVWSTSPSLGNKGEFPTFFRLVADDSFQGLVMLRLVRQLGWRKIGVLASTSTYGQDLLDKIISSADATGVDIASSFTYDLSDVGATDYRLTNLKLAGARVIITLVEGEEDAVDLFRALKRNEMIGPEYAYIGGDNMLQIGKANNAQPEDVANFEGLMMTEPLEYTDQYSGEFIQKWRTQYGYEPPSGAIAHYDATYAFAHAFKHILNQPGVVLANLTSNTWNDILKWNVTDFTAISFMGAMGPAGFQPNGDSAAANFRILNWQNANGGYRQVASGTAESLQFTTEIKWYGPAKPSDAPKFNEDTIGYQKPLPAVVMAFTSALLFLVVLSIPFLLALRNHALLKPVSPLFMAITALGMAVVLLTIYVDAKEIPDIVSCNLYMALMTIGFGTVVGGIFVKLRRLYRIFDNRISQRRVIKNQELLLNIFGVFLTELVLVLVWAGAYPLQSVEYLDMLSEKHYYRCKTLNSRAADGLLISTMLLNALLIVVCCWLAYRTRNIYSSYNEAKAIGIAIYNILFCAIIILVVTHLTDVGVLIGWIIRSCLVLVATGVTYFALIGRYVLGVLSKADAETFGLVGEGSASSGGGGGAAEALKGLGIRKKSFAAGPWKTSTLAVRGQSRITTSQWKNHVLTLFAKPAPILSLISEREPDVGIALSVSTIEVKAKEDCFTIKWPKGAVQVQCESDQDAQEWVEAFATVAKGDENQGWKASVRASAITDGEKTV